MSCPDKVGNLIDYYILLDYRFLYFLLILALHTHFYSSCVNEILGENISHNSDILAQMRVLVNHKIYLFSKS